LTGETAQLSPRAKRQLPQSFVGRSLFTWFNPGSGTGYMFAMLNLLALIGMAWILAAIAYDRRYEHVPEVMEFFPFTACLAGYVLGYLGVVRLAVVALRRITPVGLLATFLCQVILATSGVLFPLLLQALVSWGDYTSFSYSTLQLPNFFWTLIEVVDGKVGNGPELALVVASVGGLIFLVNMVVAAGEVEHVRQQAPQRVLEDEAQLHPRPQDRKKRNPWDEEPVAAQV
jgi:hypothetical protein